MRANLGDAVVAHPTVSFRVAQQFQQGVGNGVPVEWIDQDAVVAVADDVHRPAILCGDQRQPARGRLQERETEGLCQGRIDEHTAALDHQAIDLRDLVLAELLRHGDASVEVVGVDPDQQLGQHRLRTLFEISYVVAVAGNDQEVRDLLQGLGFPISLEQGLVVLARIGPGQGQDQRLVRVLQVAPDLVGKSDLLDRQEQAGGNDSGRCPAG